MSYVHVLVCLSKLSVVNHVFMSSSAHSDKAKRKQEEKSRRHSQTPARPPTVKHSLMYIPNDDTSHASTSELVIPENNFNVPQRTSDAYQISTSPVGNFNPVNDATPSVPGRLVSSVVSACRGLTQAF